MQKVNLEIPSPDNEKNIGFFLGNGSFYKVKTIEDLEPFLDLIHKNDRLKKITKEFIVKGKQDKELSKVIGYFLYFNSGNVYPETFLENLEYILPTINKKLAIYYKERASEHNFEKIKPEYKDIYVSLLFMIDEIGTIPKDEDVIEDVLPYMRTFNSILSNVKRLTDPYEIINELETGNTSYVFKILRDRDSLPYDKQYNITKIKLKFINYVRTITNEMVPGNGIKLFNFFINTYIPSFLDNLVLLRLTDQEERFRRQLIKIL